MNGNRWEMTVREFKKGWSMTQVQLVESSS